jgi:hypothetical protein
MDAKLRIVLLRGLIRDPLAAENSPLVRRPGSVAATQSSM